MCVDSEEIFENYDLYYDENLSMIVDYSIIKLEDGSVIMERKNVHGGISSLIISKEDSIW